MSTEIARHQGGPSLPDMVRYAEHLANANLLPRQYQRQPANVLFAMEYGRTLGITPIAAITGIHVIEGKPSASAALISGLVRQAGHKLRVRGDDKQAWAQIIRSDDPDYEGYQVTWTLDRAKQAGLANKDVWKKYPAAMLKARAITEVARDACEEVLFGLHYTPEELGVNVDAEGEPLEAPVQQLRQVPAGEPDQWATSSVTVDPEAFVPHPAGQRHANDAAELDKGRDHIGARWKRAAQDGVINAGILAPDTQQADVLGTYLTRLAETLPEVAPVSGGDAVVDPEALDDEHATAVAELRAFAAEQHIADIDADAYTALGAPLDDVAPDAIRALLTQLRTAA